MNTQTSQIKEIIVENKINDSESLIKITTNNNGKKHTEILEPMSLLNVHPIEENLHDRLTKDFLKNSLVEMVPVIMIKKTRLSKKYGKHNNKKSRGKRFRKKI